MMAVMRVLRRTKHRTAMGFLLWLAFVWRAWGLDFQSLWRDEVDVIRFATQPWPQLLAMFTRPGENGPLFYVLMRFWLAAVGRSEYALRFASLMMGVLAVALAMVLARRLGFPRPAAAITGLLMATNPYLTWYSQEGKMYALVTVLVLGSTLAFVEALRRGGWLRWALYWLLTTLCFYVHVLAVLVIPLHLLWFLISWRRSRRRWLGYTLALAGLTLPYLPLVWWQLKLWNSRTFNPGFPFVPLDQMATVLLLAFTRGFLPVSSAWSLTPFLFLAMAGIWLGGERLKVAPDERSLRVIAWLLLWLSFPVLALFGISLRVPLFTDRYLIWIAPALWLLAGLGTAAVARYNRMVAVLVLGSVLALHLQSTGFQTRVPIKSDFRHATAFVENQRRPGDAVMPIMPYIQHSYAYYAKAPVPWVEPPYTNAGMTPAQVDAEMRQRLRNWRGVWLVSSEESAWDRRGLVRAWLAEHGELVVQKQFTRVDVLYYHLSTSK